ncbi:MAG: alpha/beta hydrolase [Candidatus Abyssobacteria bacterium SURF_5]|uniref:Alpha/beta hydrolase n=1 Tax=Abyssobacteria bacterium (strain SURF_5) TaxID=2093360 RepID=A0A3A4MX75_ABYX5|nr:MAG: alpha/beta hydrolase [Candidatus Abyssubacteria bacterium SURF_5]
MAKASANGIEIEYDTFGDTSASPLLLIMGLAAQMIWWDEEFCEQLAAKGHFVIRFDNRDVGLSTKFDDAGIPDLVEVISARIQGKKVQAPYTLDDMADDSIGLLDALGIDSAHVCGASMGGMIAQTIAIRHPKRMRSLTSIMSTTGDPSLPQAGADVMALLITPPPRERTENIEYSVKLWRTISGSRFPFDEDFIRKKLAESYDRSFYPQGAARQIAAIVAHGDRTPALKSVNVPALAIHGSEDPLVPVECGRATARAIPGSSLLVIEGMGHNLPAGAWPQIIDAITRHTHGRSF